MSHFNISALPDEQAALLPLLKLIFFAFRRRRLLRQKVSLEGFYLSLTIQMGLKCPLD